MTAQIVEFNPEYLKIWSGTPKGEEALFFFVSYFFPDGGELIVHDGPTEAEARQVAFEWGNIPVIVRL
jgi:hypothetical protein